MLGPGKGTYLSPPCATVSGDCWKTDSQNAFRHFLFKLNRQPIAPKTGQAQFNPRFDLWPRGLGVVRKLAIAKGKLPHGNCQTSNCQREVSLATLALRHQAQSAQSPCAHEMAGSRPRAGPDRRSALEPTTLGAGRWELTMLLGPGEPAEARGPVCSAAQVRHYDSQHRGGSFTPRGRRP